MSLPLTTTFILIARLATSPVASAAYPADITSPLEFLLNNEPEQALTSAETAIASGITDATVFEGAMLASFQMGQFSKTELYATRFSNLSKSGEGPYVLGMCTLIRAWTPPRVFLRRDLMRRALAFFHEARARDLEGHDSTNWITLILLDLGDDKGLDDFTSGLHGADLYWRVYAHLKLGQIEKGRQLERVLRKAGYQPSSEVAKKIARYDWPDLVGAFSFE